MKVNGTATLNAPIDQVWAALNDPRVLAATIPGCEQLEAVGEDRYRMTITAGVASITGTYLGDVALTDREPYGSFMLRASGSGTPGTISADVAVKLEEIAPSTTALTYTADAVVGGPIGGVGQRVLTAVSKKMAKQFFAAVDAVIANGGEPVAPLPELDVVGQAGPPAIGTTFRAPSATATARDIRFDLKTQLPGVVLGAAIALLGVLVGSRISRRS
jgi:carbon monoxide dehydrogenase subunit G